MLKWSYRKYLLRRWPDVSAFGGRFERYAHLACIGLENPVRLNVEDI